MNDDRKRRTPIISWLIKLFFAVICGEALADAPIVPPDPWEMIHVVRAAAPAEVGRDVYRDPLITATAPGSDLRYQLVFHGCRFGRECTSVLLVMRLRTPEGYRRPTLSNLAEWNATRLIGRAVRDDRGRAVLEHPVVLGSGLPADTLSQTLSAWHRAMAEFTQHVVFKMK